MKWPAICHRKAGRALFVLVYITSLLSRIWKSLKIQLYPSAKIHCYSIVWIDFKYFICSYFLTDNGKLQLFSWIKSDHPEIGRRAVMGVVQAFFWWVFLQHRLQLGGVTLSQGVFKYAARVLCIDIRVRCVWTLLKTRGVKCTALLRTFTFSDSCQLWPQLQLSLMGVSFNLIFIYLKANIKMGIWYICLYYERNYLKPYLWTQAHGLIHKKPYSFCMPYTR